MHGRGKKRNGVVKKGTRKAGKNKVYRMKYADCNDLH
jgi:hypothetical protein